MEKRGWIKGFAIALAIITFVLVILGLAFFYYATHFMFGKSEPIKVPGIPVPTTPSDPYLSFKSDILLKIGESEIIEIGFYCSATGTCENAKPQIIDCIGPEGSKIDLNESGITFNAIEDNVKSHQNIGYRATLSASNQTQSGNYICKIKVDDSKNPGQEWAKSKQIILTIE